MQLTSFQLCADVRSDYLYRDQIVVVLVAEAGEEPPPLSPGDFPGVAHKAPSLFDLCLVEEQHTYRRQRGPALLNRIDREQTPAGGVINLNSKKVESKAILRVTRGM